jgi:tetratricopeptide (TPR) repeat protein
MRILGAFAAAAVLAPTALPSTPSLLGVAYICGAEQRPAVHGPRRLVIEDGMGTGGLAARAGSAEAQAWLAYGLKLYHAFYHEDAETAFAKAVALDPDCSLCAWGQSLGLGPTLNFEVPAEKTERALEAARRAEGLAKSPLEHELAALMIRRYSPELSAKARAERYADEIADLADRHAEEPDLASLAAHALITPRQEGPRMERAMAILERTLAARPDDTAAIHYYIHAAELSGRAAVALPYAERLAGLAPNASHLVHMAAHTLNRVGRYEDVAVTNARALKSDAEFSAAMAYQGALGEPRYYVHNMMFGLYGALMAGDRELALKYADHGPVAFPAGSDANRRAAVVARGLVAYGRYAPAKALALPPPPKGDPVFHPIYWRYARGEALAAAGDWRGVLRESREIARIAAPKDGGMVELRTVAAKVLAGRAAMLRNDPSRAARIYAEAADLQEKAFGTVWDPPIWWYPVRRSVAAARLKAGDYRGAVAEAERSLRSVPNDGLALEVLSEAELRLGEAAAADRHRTEARKAWLGAEVRPDLI